MGVIEIIKIRGKKYVRHGCSHAKIYDVLCLLWLKKPNAKLRKIIKNGVEL